MESPSLPMCIHENRIVLYKSWHITRKIAVNLRSPNE